MKRELLWALACALLVALAAAAGHGGDAEIAALLAFRDALSGWNEAVRSNGIQLVGWQAAGRGAAATAADAAGGNGSIASAGVCSWSSVVCDAHGRVEELNLSWPQLHVLSACERRGEPAAASTCRFELPAELAALGPPLARLPALAALRLSQLGLRGTLPSDWAGGLLSRLTVLDLSGNRLTGSFPAAWQLGSASTSSTSSGKAGSGGRASSGANSSRAAAGGSGGAGAVAGQAWPATHLDLSLNRLSGRLPAWLPTAFPGLQKLRLGGNQLQGPLLAGWLQPGAWANLTLLDLSHNPLAGGLPHALPEGPQEGADGTGNSSQRLAHPPLPALTELRLIGCGLEGTAPGDWSQFPSLRELRLDDNRLTGSLPPSWGAPAGGAAGDDATAWAAGAQAWVQGNDFDGPVPCCQTRLVVQPGNERLCTLGAPRGVEQDVRYQRYACSAAQQPEGQGDGDGGGGGAPRCSLGPAALPVCGPAPPDPVAEALALAHPPWWRSAAAAWVAGAVAAAVLLALAAAGGVQAWRSGVRILRWERAFKRRFARGEDGESDEDEEEGGAYQEGLEEEEEGEQAKLLAPGSGPSAPASGSSVGSGRFLGGRSAGSGGAPGSRRSPSSSRRLHSASIRLKPEDFQIQLDGQGKPVLLGSGAFSKVYRGQLFGALPVAIKALSVGPAQRHAEQRLWREVELLRRCTHPCIVQLLGVYSAPIPAAAGPATSAGAGGSPPQQQRQQQDLRSNPPASTQQPNPVGAHAAAGAAAGPAPSEAHCSDGNHSAGSSAGGGPGPGHALLGQAEAAPAAAPAQHYPTPPSTAQHPAVGPQQQRAPRRLMLVTELLEGGSLHDRLGEPELRWYRGGARVALDVARALAFLHRQSIAHLDVKPANVLLTGLGLAPHGGGGGGGGWFGLGGGGGWFGLGGGGGMPPARAGAGAVAKIADVGLARITGTGSAGFAIRACGTPLYAAPEQMVNGRVGLSADMYSFAWVLHAIVTGERLRRRGEGRPLRPPQDCPAQVAALITRCLSTNPAARPSAEDAALVLEVCQPGRGGPSAPPLVVESELAQLS
ncbi:serine threonine-kinase isoform B [Micractinium conductrix]|uniref:Serine threonine-kinase isoform B n=1 Tax=Micractinium conductrix TaxID=554055 RepID=A0A2P6VKX3_9CHLO|nr:serine threonine-kinase isoform B [Micractinium conductrix]|eukprot:PSC74756.1 serine threonine-kinase isoform B [Micractinium conductrix]